MHGTGATHLTIALANYLSAKLGYHTACLEVNSSAAFSRLSRKSGFPKVSSVDEDTGFFTISGVGYYANLNGDDIPLLMNAGYHYLILDFSTLSTSTVSEFLRCSQKFLLGSMAPWNMKLFSDFFELCPDTANFRENFCYLILFGEKKDIFQFHKEYAIPLRNIQAIPFLKNPFHIKQNLFYFFQTILS